MEKGITLSIVFSLSLQPVDTAVEFDGEAQHGAEEVQHIGSNAMLSTELIAVSTIALKATPKGSFSGGGIVAQLATEVGLSFWG